MAQGDTIEYAQYTKKTWLEQRATGHGNSETIPDSTYTGEG